MSEELDKCKQSGNQVAIDCQQKDFDETTELLGRHNAAKKTQISALIKVFNEWEYPQEK